MTQARASMLTRNEILDASGDRGRFTLKDRADDGFTIFDTWGKTRRAVDVVLTKDNIRIDVDVSPKTRSFTVMATLNDAGLCKFRVGTDELDVWQVLKRALEGLFFDGTE